METPNNTEDKSKGQFASYLVLAVIAVILVMFVFNLPKNREPTPAEQSSVVLSDGSSNSELEKAKDLALLNPNFLNYLNLGLIYYRSGRYEDCIVITNKALEFPAAPDKQAIAYNNICSAYNVLHQYEEATKACEKALELQPDFELAKNNLKAARGSMKR